jgi:hypothetical protein
MEMVFKKEAQSLFQRMSKDGSLCLFLILPGGGWAITCNGKPISTGTGQPASITAGIEQFRTMSSVAEVPGAVACDPLVRRHLDRLEATRTHPVGIDLAILTKGQTDHAKRYPILGKRNGANAPAAVAGH